MNWRTNCAPTKVKMKEEKMYEENEMLFSVSKRNECLTKQNDRKLKNSEMVVEKSEVTKWQWL